MSRIAAASLLIAAGLGLPALAAPFGGASLAEGPVPTLAPRGYRMPPPALVAVRDGVRVHGAVCRSSLTAATSPRMVRLEQLDADGRTLATVRARLVGNLSGRPGRGCAFYDLQISAPTPAGARLRVSADPG